MTKEKLLELVTKAYPELTREDSQREIVIFVPECQGINHTGEYYTEIQFSYTRKPENISIFFGQHSFSMYIDGDSLYGSICYDKLEQCATIDEVVEHIRADMIRNRSNFGYLDRLLSKEGE